MIHGLLVLAHVLLFVYWVGTDVGVYYVNFLVLNRDLSVETRATLAKVLLALDMGPRICLVLIFPVGLSLASRMGLSPITGPWLGLVWVAALAWLAVVLTIHHEKGSARGRLLSRGDGLFRGALVVVLAVTAVWSMVSDNGPFATTWLPLKVLLYAITVGAGLGIRIMLRDFGPALGALLAGDRSDAVEARLARSMRATYPFVYAIWVAAIGAAAVGIIKP